MGQLVAERDARRPVQAISSISPQRLDVKSFNKRQFESLAKAGAFDALNRNRAQTFAAAELLLRHAASATEERVSKQVNLFGDNGGVAGRGAARCRPRPTGCRSNSCSTNSRRSASICRAIRSTPMARASSGLAWCASADLAGARSPRAARPATRSPASSSARRSATRRAATASPSCSSPIRAACSRSRCSPNCSARRGHYLDSGIAAPRHRRCRARTATALRLTAQRFEPLDEAVAHAAAGLRIKLDAERGACRCWRS